MLKLDGIKTALERMQKFKKHDKKPVTTQVLGGMVKDGVATVKSMDLIVGQARSLLRSMGVA